MPPNQFEFSAQLSIISSPLRDCVAVVSSFLPEPMSCVFLRVTGEPPSLASGCPAGVRALTATPDGPESAC
jgi:hypothetical protein